MSDLLPPASRAYGEIGPRSDEPRWGMAVDLERCIGCAICAEYCPWETIFMVPGVEAPAEDGDAYTSNDSEDDKE